MNCPACGKQTETPLVCGACGALLDYAYDDPTFDHSSPYEVLGLEAEWHVDSKDLRKRLLRFSRLVHPDFFANSGAAHQERAEAASALLNAAYDILGNAPRRADWLVHSLGGPSEKEERQMPQAFLMEVMEWNESLDDARNSPTGSPARAGLASLKQELEERRAESLASIAASLTPLPTKGAPDLRPLRLQLNAVRYLERTLEELAAIELPEASAH